MESVRIGFFAAADAKGACVETSAVVSSCTNGLSQLKKQLFSGGMSLEKFKTRAVPLSLYCLSVSK